MTRRINTAILIFLAVSAALANSGEEQSIKPVSVQDAKLTTNLRAMVSRLHEQLSKDSARLRLFAQLADNEKSEKAGYQVPSGTIVKVLNSKSWPENTVTSYIVLMRENGTIAAFQQVPVSESGDWFNTYTHYYDEKGNTIAFQRHSSFFNGCPDSPSNETSTYYYQEHRLVSKDYSLKGNNNRTLDTVKCDFMYRHNYTIQQTWAESRRASGIGQAW